MLHAADERQKGCVKIEMSDEEWLVHTVGTQHAASASGLA